MSIRYGTQLTNNGTVSTPSIRFTNSDNTGLYLSSTNNLDVTTDGVNRLNVSTTSITSTIPHLNPNGSVSAPSYSFTGRTNTGIYSSTSNNIDITTGGVQRMTISNAAVTMTPRPYHLNGYASTSGYLGLASQASRTVSSYDAVRVVSTWTSRTTPQDNNWSYVCWSPELGLFCSVATNGTNRVMTSPDGYTWTTRSAAVANDWSAVCWAPELNIFCAVSLTGSTNRVMTSSNGTSWTSRTTPTSNNFHDICWAAEPTLDGNVGTFVAVAFSGTNNRVMTSPDGINWTSRSTPVDNDWRGVCWAPELGLFCAVARPGSSGNLVMTSQDGITWTTRSSPADYVWRSVCWSPELGLFCAVAETASTSSIMTSPDGIVWSTQTSVVTCEFTSVCWAPEIGLFCAVNAGAYGSIVVTSPNGITWTTRTTPSNDYRSVCWAPELGLFCAVAATGTGNRVMTSLPRPIYNRSLESGVLTVPSGSATTPTYTFTGREDTGFYLASTSNLTITTSGVDRVYLSNTRTTINGSLASTGQSVLFLSGNISSANTIPSSTTCRVAGNGATVSNLAVFNSVYQQGTEITWVPSTGIVNITPVVGGGWFLFNVQLAYSNLATSNTGVVEFTVSQLTGTPRRWISMLYPNLNNARSGVLRMNASAIVPVTSTNTFELTVFQTTGVNVSILGFNVIQNYFSITRLH